MLEEFQKNYYDKEWGSLDLTDEPSSTGWRTTKPSIYFFEFIEFLRKRSIVGKVLDLGCGAGRYTFEFAREHFDSYGIDFSENAIELANKQANLKKLKNIKFTVGDVLNLPYEDEIFDILNDDGCFHHIEPENWDKYLLNITRVIKKNGIFRIKVISANCKFFKELNGSEKSQWIKSINSNYMYFFNENDIRDIFEKEFNIIDLKEQIHDHTDKKKFFFVIMEKK